MTDWGQESNLYGAGTYFTTHACKAIEYSSKNSDNGPCCLIVARVALGHPYMAPSREHHYNTLTSYA